MGVGACLICQSYPRPRYKGTLVTYHQPSSFLSFLQFSARALVRADRYDVASEEKRFTATTGSHSPEASAALSRRPSNHESTFGNDADEAPGFPNRQKLVGASALDAGTPLSSLQVS
jgi:hypothetical protein